MNVELTTVITPDDLTLLRKFYEESFPAAERRDWQLIVSPKLPGSPELYAIIADGRLAGMLTLWNFDRFSYVEHFAIAPELRSRGVGSEAMRQLMEKIGNRPLVVEIEPPTADHPETLSRRDFYSRLGFSTISTDYIQPPYSASLPPVPMHLMATTILPAQSTASVLHREVYGK